MAGVTGDKAQKQVALIALELDTPIVLDAAGVLGTNTLKVASHVVNQTGQSGKQTGAMCLVAKPDFSEFGLAVARGSSPTDKWAVLAFDPAKDVTPV